MPRMSFKSLISRILAEAFESKFEGKHGAKRLLAKRVGVSDSQLGRFLTGERSPTASEFIALAKELDIAPGLFWAISGESDAADEAIIQLVTILNAIEPDRRAGVVDALLASAKQMAPVAGKKS